MRIFLVAILSLFLLTGCSWTKDLVVKTEPVKKIPLVLPEADKYSHRNIDWIIITPENAEEVFANLKKKGQPVVIIGLTGEDYEKLALNMGDTQALIKQLKSIISAYEKYYIAVEKRDTEHNKKADQK